MSSERSLVRSRLYLMPVPTSDREWPQVRRYRLVRLRGASPPRENPERRLRTPPYE
jgi:hypothetical protein